MNICPSKGSELVGGLQICQTKNSGEKDTTKCFCGFYRTVQWDCWCIDLHFPTQKTNLPSFVGKIDVILSRESGIGT